MKLPVSGRILCALLALSGVVAAPIARAQAWPERPITLLMPYVAGGATDIAVREISRKMSDDLGQPIIVENKPRPGQIAIGSYGVGTPPHLAIELMKMRFGIDVIHVPYNGSNPAMIDLRGGRIPVLMDFLPSQVRTITDGEVVGLAIGQKTRSTLVPQVPTFDEAGMAGMEITTFFGIAAPVGTPPAILERISEAARRALEDPALRKSAEARGLTLVHANPTAFAEALKRERALAATIIKTAGIENVE